MRSGFASGSPVGHPGFVLFRTIKNLDAKKGEVTWCERDSSLFTLASASCPYSYLQFASPSNPPYHLPSPTTPPRKGRMRSLCALISSTVLEVPWTSPLSSLD